MVVENELTKRIKWLMDDRAQADRPRREQGKWALSGGLHLWLKQVGPAYVLALTRPDTRPSESELKTMGEAIMALEPKPYLMWQSVNPAARPSGGTFYFTLYLCWCMHEVEMVAWPQMAQQPLLKGAL